MIKLLTPWERKYLWQLKWRAKGLDISYHILLLMKRAEPVKLHKLHARPEETEKPSSRAKYALVVTRFQVQ